MIQTSERDGGESQDGNVSQECSHLIVLSEENLTGINRCGDEVQQYNELLIKTIQSIFFQPQQHVCSFRALFTDSFYRNIFNLSTEYRFCCQDPAIGLKRRNDILTMFNDWIGHSASILLFHI